jgi:DHA2 family multidrug resistance protein-like MFS transporter
MSATTIETDGIAPAGRRRMAYTAMSVATTMSVIDGSIANIALPTIARELHVGAAAIVWVVNAFNLAVTGSLIAAAAYGASLGLTRVYRAGIVVFTAGSLSCALSTSFAFLVAARVAQGVGAAMIMAIAPALVRSIFPRALLVRAFGWNSVIVSAAGAAGPTAGGLLLAVLPWPWLFAINVPLSFVTIALGSKTLPEVSGAGRPPDVASLLASGVGFSLLVYGIDGFSRRESALAIALEIGIGGAVFAWFVARQFRLPRPIIALDLFRLPVFSSAAGTSIATWTAWGAGFVTLPFVFQLDRGFSPLVAGLLLTAWPLGTALTAPFASRLTDRISVRTIATIGLTVFAVALLLYTAFSHVAPIAALLAFGAIAGVGFGCFQAPNNSELLGSAPPEKSASAGALLATLRVSGQTLGGSIVAITFAWAERAHAPAFASAAAPVALGIASAFAVVAIAVSVGRSVDLPRIARDQP